MYVLCSLLFCEFFLFSLMFLNASEICFSNSCSCSASDCQGHLVVLHFQAVGVARHRDFHSPKEVQSSVVPARLSSRLYVLAVVDRRQVGRRRNVYVKSLKLFLNVNNLPKIDCVLALKSDWFCKYAVYAVFRRSVWRRPVSSSVV